MKYKTEIRFYVVTGTTLAVPSEIHTQLDIGILADVSILVTGFGRFRTVFIYALFGLNLGNPV